MSPAAPASHMLCVPITSATPGMELALPVLHPGKCAHVLLRNGACLDPKTIRRLRELEVPDLWITMPGLEFVARHVSPSIMTSHARLTGTLAQSFDVIADQTDPELPFDDFAHSVRGLLDQLINDQAAAILFREMVDTSRPLAARSGNLCYLCLTMGLKLDAYLIQERDRIPAHRAKNVETLGLGAMLHDIGMLRLPADVRVRFDVTHDESDPAWRDHVILGWRMLHGRVPPTAATMALDHHQRFDGHGFPLHKDDRGRLVGKSGSDIHIFSRILAVADLYDRQRHPPDIVNGGLRTVPNVRALKRMVEAARAGLIDPVVLKALLSVVPAFLPGSMVLLNDGTKAVVTAWDPTEPCRPTVVPWEVLLDEDRDASLAMEINLLTHPELSVARAEGVDVSGDLFEPLHPREFDVRVQSATEYPPEPIVR